MIILLAYCEKYAQNKKWSVCMKKFKSILMASMLVMATALAGCSGDAADAPAGDAAAVPFTLGQWNDTTFENEWLNMKIAAPADTTISSDEEIAQLMGVGADILSQSTEGDTDALKNIADLATSYGFMITNSTGTFNSQLVYENLDVSGGPDTTEEEYANIVAETILQVPELDYADVGRSEVEIAGKTFYKMELTMSGGLVAQDYYLYKQDNYMVSFIVTYTEDMKATSDAFVAGITTLK